MFKNWSRKLLAKIVSKVLKNKFGADTDILFDKIDIVSDDNKIIVNVNAYISFTTEEMDKLIDSI